MRKIAITLISVLSIFWTLAPLFAYAGSITQGYKAATELSIGSVVSLTSNGSQDVVKSNIDNDALVAGVVVDAASSLLDVLPAGSQVRVATTGDIKILVSTINGNISSGSRLISSPLSGIAALDYPPAPGQKYIAVANVDFSQSSKGAKKVSVTQNDGKTKDVYVGIIDARILLSNRTSSSNKSKNILETVGKIIGGKDVSILQVLTAGAIFITTLGISGMIMFSSIKGSFVSIGRNPLSKDSILSGLIKVVALSIIIFGAGTIVAYFILQI